jgi:protein-S-isoprenylcysteine O-methyltransferase Ste14
MASGDLLTLIASLAATLAAYAYRIRVEDAMLVAHFGPSYRAGISRPPRGDGW